MAKKYVITHQDGTAFLRVTTSTSCATSAWWTGSLDRANKYSSLKDAVHALNFYGGVLMSGHGVKSLKICTVKVESKVKPV